MSLAERTVFDRAVHTSNTWLTDVATALDTDDIRFAHRVLRAWLHALRDRLTVDSAAKFGAQLPELLRGIYYDGWVPSKAPIKYGSDEFSLRFAEEARIATKDVRGAISATTRALADHLSPGLMTETLAQLPAHVRALLTGPVTAQTGTAPTASATRPAEVPSTPPERFAHLEDQVSTLTEALQTLARSLENSRMRGLDTDSVARAARLADEIIMASHANPTP
ncbi:DUF2267 domain-containing protein [Dactylosporangium cerinum]|uniref:DUF2267 domain-containing protein n=1 Tax=Dactylosporangium cerinum TaxID=1434730 RepID=A0ABV9VZQ7_9ACTN